MHRLRNECGLAETIVFAVLFIVFQSAVGRGDVRQACPSPLSKEHWIENVVAQECRMLQRFPDVARRQGDRLVISLSSGRTITFKNIRDQNSPAYCEKCEDYYLDTIDNRSHVVRIWKAQAESAQVFLLDDQSGEAILTGDYPQASPDGEYYATVDAGPGPVETDDIEIIRHRGGHFQLVGLAARSLCGFERWDAVPSFMMKCYDRPNDTVKEYRVMPDHRGGLIQTETGRRLGQDEQDNLWGP